MIILKVKFSDNVVFHSKGNPPVGCYRDTVFAFPGASERVKLPTRHSGHLREVIGELQCGQDRLDLLDPLGGKTAWVIILVKASKTFVPEPPDDHDQLYGITVRMSRREKGLRESKLLTLDYGQQDYRKISYQPSAFSSQPVATINKSH